MHDNAALMSLNIADGDLLWELSSASEMSLPMVQPHEAGNDKVVVSTEPGVALLDVKRDGDQWSVADAWGNNKLRAGFNDFVLHNGCLFGLDDGVLCCLDLANGERLWKKGRLGHGQILLLSDQDLLLVSTDKGEIILVSVDRTGFKELGRFKPSKAKRGTAPCSQMAIASSCATAKKWRRSNCRFKIQRPTTTQRQHVKLVLRTTHSD